MTKITALHEVLYVSTIAPAFPITVVKDIAVQARLFYQAHDITGLLIFDGMHFCQQLEGEQKVVLMLLEEICSDERHTNVAIIHNAPLAERRFRHFSLGYPTFDDVDVLEKLQRLDGLAAVEAFLALAAALDMEA